MYASYVCKIFFLLCMGESKCFLQRTRPLWGAARTLPAFEVGYRGSETSICPTNTKQPISIVHAIPTQRHLATCF